MATDANSLFTITELCLHSTDLNRWEWDKQRLLIFNILMEGKITWVVHDAWEYKSWQHLFAFDCKDILLYVTWEEEDKNRVISKTHTTVQM